MNTTVEKLLPDIAFRLEMIEKGAINPPNQVKEMTRQLVKKLSQLDPREEIKTTHNERSLVQYMRASTGEVLAELYEK